MTTVPEKTIQDAASTIRLAQIVSLVRDNQLVTALVLFILWQIGALSAATQYIGGVC